MKRVITISLALIMCVGLAGCGNNESNSGGSPSSDTNQTADVSNLSSDELLAKYISDMDAIKADELLNLVNTLANYQYDSKLEVEPNSTSDALSDINWDGTIVEPQKFVIDALDSDSPLVREVAIAIFDRYQDECLADADCVARINKEIDEEQDPYVLQAIFFDNADKVEELPKLSERALKEMKNDSPEVRAATELIVVQPGDEATKEYLVEYLADESPKVQIQAISDIPAFHDDSLVEPIVTFVSNPDLALDHWIALGSLADMSMNAPFFDAKSSVAWNALIDYFDQEYNDNIPSANAIKAFESNDDTSEKFINWRDTTDYVDKNAVVDIMYRIVQSDEVSWLAVDEAISVVHVYGTPEQYLALEQMIKDRTNTSMQDTLLENYQALLEK